MAVTPSLWTTTLVLLVLIFFTVCITSASYSPCFTKKMRSIPRDHLMYKKTKPLVIGHRGNPMKYQENTLDGFKSLLETNADGFEMDIYVTKDDKLVVFHKDNTEVLTGVNKIVWETNADELTKLTIKDSLIYGKNTYTFTKRRHIPLLEDVLKAMKGSGKIMFLEIKPTHARSFEASTKAGRLVAAMVTRLGLVNQATITSFDPVKTRGAHQENPNIPTGLLYVMPYWKPNGCNNLQDSTRMLPEMEECQVRNITDCTSFMKEVFDSGDVLKAVNSSFVDMLYEIYDNPLYSNNTFETLRKNYSPSISAGAAVIYSMALANDSTEAGNQDTVIDRFVEQKMEHLITDDVYRLLRKLGRPAELRPSLAVREIPCLLGYVLSLLFSVTAAFYL